MKTSNEYAEAITPQVYTAIPKAVLAAVAVSSLTVGGDQIEHARDRVVGEWWALYEAHIVPQKPPFPRPSSTDGPMD